jgi:hypothetical protein
VLKARTVRRKPVNGSVKEAARLVGDKRQNNELVLAFMDESRSEAPRVSEEGTESLAAKRRTESPAIVEQLMEVCERENWKQAFGTSQGQQRKRGRGWDDPFTSYQTS